MFIYRQTFGGSHLIYMHCHGFWMVYISFFTVGLSRSLRKPGKPNFRRRRCDTAVRHQIRRRYQRRMCWSSFRWQKFGHYLITYLRLTRLLSTYLLAMDVSTSGGAQTFDYDTDGENSLLKAIKHQQMLLYVVCGLGGALVLLLVVCIVCKCKQSSDATKPQRRPPRKPRTIRVRPDDKPETQATHVRNAERTRKRSRDMRNYNDNFIASEEISGPSQDFRATHNGFLSP